MDKSILTALSKQINREFYSSYLYLAMAGWADDQHLPGFAVWMVAQANEEHEHGMKLLKYVADRGARADILAIEAPPTDYKSPVKMFEEVLAHEQEVTANIYQLYELTQTKKDYPTQIELQWFIKEQVEEEKSATEILNLLKMVKDSPQGLISLDRQLARRAG